MSFIIPPLWSAEVGAYDLFFQVQLLKSTTDSALVFKNYKNVVLSGTV